MEVQLVRLSRPLLLATGRYKDGYLYQTVYGFLVQESSMPIDPEKLNHYVGYLAGLHCVSNGDGYFSISYEERGVPDWKDKKGVVHTKQDCWMNKIEKQCMEKLQLSYDLINVDVDEDDLYHYLNSQDLIVDEDFYYDMEDYLDEKGALCIDGSDDELPF